MPKKNKDVFQVQPKNNQKPVINFLRENRISVLTGMAGTGKDFCCLYRAFDGLVKKEFSELVLIKPIIEIGKTMGFLPGDVEDKIEKHYQSFNNNKNKILNIQELKKVENKIRYEPLNFMRGDTIENAVVILTEAQNCTLHELISLSTRLSDSSVMYINGDTEQSDIGNRSGLKDYLKIVKNVEDINVLNLDSSHQTRSKFIVDLIKSYSNFKASKS